MKLSLLSLHPRRWPAPVVIIVSMFAVFMIGAMVVSIGSRVAGSVADFHTALIEARPWFFAWRIAMYAHVIAVWWKIYRPALMSRLSEDKDGGHAARARLAQLERLCIGLMVLNEVTNLAAWMRRS